MILKCNSAFQLGISWPGRLRIFNKMLAYNKPPLPFRDIQVARPELCVSPSDCAEPHTFTPVRHFSVCTPRAYRSSHGWDTSFEYPIVRLWKMTLTFSKLTYYYLLDCYWIWRYFSTDGGSINKGTTKISISISLWTFIGYWICISIFTCVVSWDMLQTAASIWKRTSTYITGH